MKFLPILCFCAFISVNARTGVVIFPFENNSGNERFDWISSSVPEMFFRKTIELPAVHVWNPVFLFQADTLNRMPENDTLLKQHAQKWGWNIAVGGFFTVKNDSIEMTIRVIRLRKNKQIEKIKKMRGTTQKYFTLSSNLGLWLLDFCGITLSSQDSEQFINPISINNNAYATYAAGYHNEIHQLHHKAFSSYSHSVTLDNGLYPAFLRLAVLMLQSGNIEKARSFFDRAAAREPQSSLIIPAHASFVVDYEDIQKATTFIDSKKKILEKTPDGIAVLGKNQITQGALSRAISLLGQSVAGGPSDLGPEFNLGKAYHNSGQYALAIETFTRLIQYCPQNELYHLHLGMALRNKGDLIQSKKILENACEINPKSAPCLISLSNTYYKLGWFDKAKYLLTQARQISPDLNAIFINLGVIYWHEGLNDSAALMFKHATQFPENAQSAIISQGNMLFLKEDISGALKLYQKAEKLDKKNRILLFNLGTAYLKTDMLNEAELCFTNLLEITPSRVDVLTPLAIIAERKKNTQARERYLKNILELDPDNIYALDNYIMILKEQDRLQEAVTLVEGFLKKHPDNSQYRLLLPEIYRKMGWYKVSKEGYEKLLNEKEYKNSYPCIFGLGMTLYDMVRFQGLRNYKPAIEYLEKAAKIRAANPEPDIIIGTIYNEYARLPKQALTYWNRALEKTKNEKAKEKIRNLMAKVKK